MNSPVFVRTELATSGGLAVWELYGRLRQELAPSAVGQFHAHTKEANRSKMPIFLTTKEAVTLLGISPTTLKIWRLGKGKTPPRLKQGVHWVSPSARQVLYHRELMLDFLANQHRPELHQKAVDAYLESLPSSKAANS